MIGHRGARFISYHIDHIVLGQWKVLHEYSKKLPWLSEPNLAQAHIDYFNITPEQRTIIDQALKEVNDMEPFASKLTVSTGFVNDQCNKNSKACVSLKAFGLIAFAGLVLFDVVISVKCFQLGVSTRLLVPSMLPILAIMMGLCLWGCRQPTETLDVPSSVNPSRPSSNCFSGCFARFMRCGASSQPNSAQDDAALGHAP